MIVVVAPPINSGPLSTRWAAWLTAERPCLSRSKKFSHRWAAWLTAERPCLSRSKKLSQPLSSAKKSPSGRFPDDEMMQDARSIDARLTGHEFLAELAVHVNNATTFRKRREDR